MTRRYSRRRCGETTKMIRRLRAASRTRAENPCSTRVALTKTLVSATTRGRRSGTNLAKRLLNVRHNLILGDSSIGRTNGCQRRIELSEDFLVALQFGIQKPPQRHFLIMRQSPNRCSKLVERQFNTYLSHLHHPLSCGILSPSIGLVKENLRKTFQQPAAGLAIYRERLRF